MQALIRSAAGRLPASPGGVALAGGLVFLAIFLLAWSRIDPRLFQYRDDGIITLSHARNWVEFGFIGINPSGERVEGFSAPLQFLLYALAYALSAIGFKPFLDLQTLACTFALGAVFALFFRRRPVFAVVAAAGAAVVLANLFPFLEWQGSGMENPITHVLLLGTALVLFEAADAGRLRQWLVVVPVLASVSRIDSIVHVAPLVAVFCLYWWRVVRDRQALRFAATALLLWLGLNLCRYLYFGTLMPNTALAQGIAVGERLLALAAGDPAMLDQSFGVAQRILVAHGGWLLLLALPFLVWRPWDRRLCLLVGLCACLVLSGLASPFLFGPARLDAPRTTTHMAPAIVLLLAAAANGLRLRAPHRYVLPVFAAIALVLFQQSQGHPYALCCELGGFERTREAVVEQARSQAIVRPSLANPDLGVVSWHKQLNVVDLGLLGSPVIATLDSGPALNEYFYEFIAPDFIESHGYWSCKYKALLLDPRFDRRYRPLEPAGTPAGCGGAQVPTGVWVREDILRGSGTRERQLMDDLQAHLTVDRLSAELAHCSAASAGRGACAYVARSAYRMLPEFVRRGEEGRLAAVFASSPTRPFDLYLIHGRQDAQAWRPFVAWLTAP